MWQSSCPLWGTANEILKASSAVVEEDATRAADYVQCVWGQSWENAAPTDRRHWLEPFLVELAQCLRSISKVHRFDPRVRDDLLAFGERISVSTIAKRLVWAGIDAVTMTPEAGLGPTIASAELWQRSERPGRQSSPLVLAGQGG